MQNPFEDFGFKDDDPMGQVPFTVEELAAIVSAAMKPEHDLIRPVLFACICTAMRRGDCCLLRWSDVHLDDHYPYIRVKTAKKGKYALIPLFPLLEAEIRRQLPARNEFVFPAAARQYEVNADLITDLSDRVFKGAGFYDAEDIKPDDHRGNLRAERVQGLRKARLHGLHSFRKTWITLALTAGVPMELVRRVTSHQSVEIVLERYFKPGREDFIQALSHKMPRLFMLGAGGTELLPAAPPVETEETMVAALESMTSENWREVRERILRGLSRNAPAPGAAQIASISIIK